MTVDELLDGFHDSSRAETWMFGTPHTNDLVEPDVPVDGFCCDRDGVPWRRTVQGWCVGDNPAQPWSEVRKWF